jgi:hypothetical protein
MTIFEVVKFTSNGVVYYEPLRGFALWKHCNNGNKWATGYQFENVVKPLLLIHGIKEVNIV